MEGVWADFHSSSVVMNKDMTNLMSIPEKSDFILKIGDKRFLVHKSVLRRSSNIFRAMFFDGMKEAIITDVDESTFEEVLHFLYTGNLSGKDYDFHSASYVAEKYQIMDLNKFLEKKNN